MTRAPESAATPVFLISSSANNRERKEGKKNSSLSADGEKTAGLVRDEERSNGGGNFDEDNFQVNVWKIIKASFN